MRVALLALVLLPLGLPLAAAQGDALCIIFIEPSEDFRFVRIHADLILDDEERANISRDVDADANGDLTQAEVDAYAARKVERVTNATQMGARILYLDAAPPQQLTVRVQMTNWTGPVERARANGTVSEAREYDFGNVRYDYQHAYSGGLGAHPYRIPKPVIEVVVITAPEGWLVTSVSQANTTTGGDDGPTRTTPYSGNRFQGQASNVTLKGFDLDSAFTMEFRDATPTYPTNYGPGFEAVALVGGATVALLVLALRRR